MARHGLVYLAVVVPVARGAAFTIPAQSSLTTPTNPWQSWPRRRRHGLKETIPERSRGGSRSILKSVEKDLEDVKSRLDEIEATVKRGGTSAETGDRSMSEGARDVNEILAREVATLRVTNDIAKLHASLTNQITTTTAGLKDELRGDIVALKDELTKTNTEIASLNLNLTKDIAGLRGELREDVAALNLNLAKAAADAKIDMAAALNVNLTKAAADIKGDSNVKFTLLGGVLILVALFLTSNQT
jgi:hypothetical protein